MVCQLLTRFLGCRINLIIGWYNVLDGLLGFISGLFVVLGLNNSSGSVLEKLFVKIR